MINDTGVTLLNDWKKLISKEFNILVCLIIDFSMMTYMMYRMDMILVCLMICQDLKYMLMQ